MKAALAALFVSLFLLLLGSLLGQFMVPWLAADVADGAPEVAHLVWPYSIAGIAGILCFQVAVVAVWKLASMAVAGTVFTEAALRPATVFIWACVVAAALCAGVWIHLLVVVGTGGPGALFLLTGAVLVSATGALLMIVLRGLLRAATMDRLELESVV